MTQETVVTKKRRGPAPTGKGTQLGLRLQPPTLSQLDAWISAQPEPRPSRPEAVRLLLQRGLQPEQAGETLRAAYERLWREIIQDAQDPDKPEEERAVEQAMLAERLSDKDLAKFLEDAAVWRCEEVFKVRMKAARRGKART
jgi:hypothetical protein